MKKIKTFYSELMEIVNSSYSNYILTARFWDFKYSFAS